MTSREIEFSSHAGNLSLVRRYAYANAPDQLMRLKLECADRVVRCRLRDYGQATDPAQLNGRALEVVRPGGLGLHLIRQAFDNAYYVRRPKGTELVLVKSLVCAASGSHPGGIDRSTQAA